MTVYLCTCGTSAAKNIPRDAKFGPQWVETQGGVEAAAKILLSSFNHCRFNDEVALTRTLSAEIHSLARLELNTKDRVVLFHSATPDGHACALAVQWYLRQEVSGLLCEIKEINGLQVRDADVFRQRGVVEFTKAILREIDTNGNDQCVLNPTGGFKSLVPYTVLIGMLKNVRAYYIFEQSKALIALPMMPVDFARERMEPIRYLLENIQQNSAISRSEFKTALSNIPHEERKSLEPLFETDGDDVTMSPVGFLVWDALERPTARVPYLSRKALDDLIKIRKIAGINSEQYISRIASSDEAFQKAKHESWGDNLYWLKPGEHTTNRYLVSVDGWRFLVWRIVIYEEYIAMLQGKREGRPEVQIQWDRHSKYEPFIRMDLYENSK